LRGLQRYGSITEEWRSFVRTVIESAFCFLRLKKEGKPILNTRILDKIELSPEMNRMILEALISKKDHTSLYASKLIMEQDKELSQQRAPGTLANNNRTDN